MPFIKSHSNYVLKSRHQDVNDGTIFERDITTIGAVDQFSPGQTPIYRSNNFIITVRNDGKPSNQYNSSKWKENDEGEIWTLQTVSGMVSDFEDDNDTKIILKQDYYDFRDFAYYGSLTELFRASVTDIIRRFPGELYVTNDHAYYTKAYTYNLERIEENVVIGGDDYYLVSNPFGINVHTPYRENNVDPLKYFANDGYKNYRVGKTKSTYTNSDNPCVDESGLEGNIDWDDITEWEVITYDPCDLCKYFSVNLVTTTVKAEGETVTAATYTISDEEKIYKDSVGIISKASWITNVLVKTNGEIVITAEANTTEESRDAKLTVTAKTEYDEICSTEIKIHQNKPLCNCDSLTPSPIPQVIPQSGYTVSTKIGSYTADACVTTVTNPTSDKNWVYDLTIENGDIKAKVNAHVGDTNRTATISIEGITNDGDTCIKTFEITQGTPSPCNCNNLVISLQQTIYVNGRILSRSAANLRGETTTETPEELKRRIAKVTIKTENGSTYEIFAYLDENDNVIYLAKKENIGLHIRPQRKFLDVFYSECDNFQKLLMNEDTRYNAIFSVIRENKDGYYREFVPFQFPIGNGGYNIDATDYGFNSYTTQMVQIGEYYDENFTDNLWRSMTHEAIKNFDWSYTREYVQGDDEEYIVGGQRIQKALRIFAREFDEIISYINNIKNLNRITYDERSNMPDYFLTDAVENEGWDVKLVYPYELTEYYYEDGNKIICKDSWVEGGSSCDGQLNNMACGNSITRDFSQNSTNKVKPYSRHMITDGTENGYFVICEGCVEIMTSEVTVSSTEIPCEGGTSTITWTKTYTGTEKARMTIDTPCSYGKSNYVFIKPESLCETTFYDDCALGGKGVLKNRIKTYTDESEWSYQQINNEFLRRLKINSRHIWRHKGTIDGIEMILGMFGMKSKRWVEAHPEWVIKCEYTDCDAEDAGSSNCHEMWDYDLQEYTSFASRIEETWDVVHQDYRINWINSTKAITYDNRSVSNYTRYGANPNIQAYQGIPVAYREAYLSQEGDNAYLGYLEGSSIAYYHDEKNNKIIKRYLYPYFDKNEELDGNPYFQMNGGWLSKEIIGDNNKIWNFQFDANNNIIYNEYLRKGSVSNDGFINDNKPLFKETVRNIRRVDTIGDLLTIPTINLYNGVICHVTRIEKESAVIDNIVYPIEKEWYVNENNEGSLKKYIKLIKTDGYIKVGNNKFFDTNIIIYGVDGNEFNCDIESKYDGYELKAYINADGNFICKEDYSGNYSISNFQILDELPNEGFSNYFILNDINYADVLSKFDADTNNWTNGWRRLSTHEDEYLKVNTIENYYNGNNPHNGNMIYDNGHEYFTYYNRIFKHAADNDLFDERCYEDYYDTLDSQINLYRFNGLIEENEEILQYDDFLVPDKKIHYFGNYKTKTSESKSDGNVNIDTVWIYGDDTYQLTGDTKHTGGYSTIYKEEANSVLNYNLSAANSFGWIESFNPYNELTAKTDQVYNEETNTYEEVSRYPIIDDVTKQIVNNKIFDITFRLHNIWYTKEGQEELKYIDDVVMNYLTQMIPSTTIFRVKYDLTDVIPTVVEPSSTTNTNTGPSVSKTIIEEYQEDVISSTVNCDSTSKKISTVSHWGKSIDVMQQAGPCCNIEGDPCNCENCQTNTLTIANTSMTAGSLGGTLTTTYTVKDSNGNDITSSANVEANDESLPTWITSFDVSNGNITINVSANDDINSQNRNCDLIVKWYIKNEPCENKTISVSQPPFNPCDYIETFVLNEIPNTGITASQSNQYQIGTYTLINGGDDNKVSVTCSSLELQCSNGKVYLGTAIPPNDAEDCTPKTFKFEYNYNSKKCDEINKVQPCYNACSEITWGTLRGSIPSSGLASNTTIVTYSIEGNGNVEVVVKNTKDNINYTTVTSTTSATLNVTIPPNTNLDESDIPFTIICKYKDKQCESKDIIQPANSVCDNITAFEMVYNVNNNLVPPEGLEVNKPIARLTANDISQISAELKNNNDGSTVGVTTGIVEGGVQAIILSEPITQNEGTSKIPFSLKIYYNGKLCQNENFKQDAYLPCDCDDLEITLQE